MVAAHELGLGLDGVERRTVHLGGDGDEEDDERHDAEPDHVPVPDAVGLRGHDAVRRQRPGDEHDRRGREAERGLVGDHLRARAHRAHRAGYLDPEPQPARITPYTLMPDIARRRRIPIGGSGDLQVEGVARDGDEPADRDDAERDERGQQHQVRRELEDEPVGLVRDEVLLEEELGPVGERLEDPERTPALRSDTALHVRDGLALEPDHEHHRDEQGAERHEDPDRDDGELRPVHAAGEQRIAGRDERPHSDSILTSVTSSSGLTKRMRDPLGTGGVTVEVDAHGPADDGRVGGTLHGDHRALERRSQRNLAVARTDPVEVVGVGAHGRIADEAPERGRRLDRGAAVVEPPPRHEPSE